MRVVAIWVVGVVACGEVALPGDAAPGVGPDAALIDAAPSPPDAAWPAAVTVTVASPGPINSGCPGGTFTIDVAGGVPSSVLAYTVTMTGGTGEYGALGGPIPATGSLMLDPAGATRVLASVLTTSATPLKVKMVTTDGYDRVREAEAESAVVAGPACAR